MKQLVTSFGYNPDEVLRRDSFADLHRAVAGLDEESDVAKLTRVLRQAFAVPPRILSLNLGVHLV